MVAIFTLIVVLICSLIIVRVSTVALMLTGLSRDLARFQARSAYTGSGFTTGESEQVVSHPVRRRIIMFLMLLGNAGIVTAIATLVISFTQVRESVSWFEGIGGRMALLIAGLLLLFLVARSSHIDRWMSKVISIALKRWTTLDARDYANLLHLSGDYAVSELQVQKDDWLAGKTLMELRLNHEGVLVLGVSRRDGKYIGAPRGHTCVEVGDTLLIYGRGKTLADLDQRRVGFEGGIKHVEAVVEQKSIERSEKEEEETQGASKT